MVNIIIDIISDVRGEKTKNNVSLKTTVKKLVIYCNKELKDLIISCELDFKATLYIEELIINENNQVLQESFSNTNFAEFNFNNFIYKIKEIILAEKGN